MTYSLYVETRGLKERSGGNISGIFGARFIEVGEGEK